MNLILACIVSWQVWEISQVLSQYDLVANCQSDQSISCCWNRTALERRQIPRTTIERVLESPEQKLPVLEKIICYQSRVNFGGKQYLLRVMVNEAAEQSVVVTVYRTSKVRKYWKEP